MNTAAQTPKTLKVYGATLVERQMHDRHLTYVTKNGETVMILSTDADMGHDFGKAHGWVIRYVSDEMLDGLPIIKRSYFEYKTRKEAIHNLELFIAGGLADAPWSKAGRREW